MKRIVRGVARGCPCVSRGGSLYTRQTLQCGPFSPVLPGRQAPDSVGPARCAVQNETARNPFSGRLRWLSRVL